MSKQTAKLIARIAENLPEMTEDIRQGWIENPKALQKFLLGLCPSANGSIPEPKVFKTIKLGTGLKTADDFRLALRDGEFRLSDWASDILGKPAFKVADEETEIDLVKVTVAELGFKKGARRDQIYEKAQEFGLALCPSEVGPQLRLQYRDQPNGEWVLTGMNPIIDSGGDPRVFNVRRDDSDFWLNDYWGDPDSVWHPDYQWVFVRPGK